MTLSHTRAPTLRFGIVGLGQAALITVPAILRHPHTRVTAAAALDQEALTRFEAEHAVEAYTTIEICVAALRSTRCTLPRQRGCTPNA